MKRLIFAIFAAILSVILTACSGVAGDARYNGLAGIKITPRDSWNVDCYDENFTETPEESGDLDFLEYDVDEFGDVYFSVAAVTNGEPDESTAWGYGLVTAHIPYGEFRDLKEYADTYLLSYFKEEYFGDFEAYSLRRKSYGQVKVNGIIYYKAAYEQTEHGEDEGLTWNYDVYAAKSGSSEGDLYLLVEVEYCGKDRVSAAFAKNFVKSVARP